MIISVGNMICKDDIDLRQTLLDPHNIYPVVILALGASGSK